jgi:hypothetical protein
MYINLKVIDPAMAQAINGRPLIAVTWVWFQASACEIGGQTGNGTSSIFRFSPSGSFHQWSILILTYMTF